MNAGPSNRPAAGRAGAYLTVDLGAVRANYRLLAERVGPAVACAGVLKADAYGLGMDAVAPALAQAGCRVFFSAHLDEGIRLRRLLPRGSTIYVLHGAMPGVAADCVEHELIPVLNDPGQIAEWRAVAARFDRVLPAALQFDTAMSRMGLAPVDIERLCADSEALAGIRPVLVMSHLACADEPGHPLNASQRDRFAALRARFPGVAGSLANSSGVFLGQDYHHELVRPGAALYGINPHPGRDNPLAQPVQLHARIVQVRDIAPGDAVGYGARFVAARPTRIATVAIGYADGWLRSLSKRGHAWIDGVRVPVAGTVSMDSTTLDVTGIDPARLSPGSTVELLGPRQTIDQVALDAGTIGYEVLTRLGSRFERRYLSA